MRFSTGDRVPDIVGATADGRFWSLEAQAGRPAILVLPGGADTDDAVQLMTAIARAAPQLETLGVDALLISPVAPDLAMRFADDPAATARIVYATAGVGGDGPADPMAVLIDRGARIVDRLDLDSESDLGAWLAQLAPRIASEAPRTRTSSAPVLILPNVASPAFCQALIDHFESSAHAPGGMASVSNGVAYTKLDEDKKKRRDMELTADSPLYGEALQLLGGRCVPEIRRAFQADATYVDRILIARYDDTGGYFKRHRDDAAPQTAFRDFAISLNLNTQDYDGGELLFPEYDDHRYSPLAGGAIIFSASVLHEAAPVLRGSRYVLLTFLATEASQAKHNQWLASQG